VSPAAEAIILKCLAPERADRYQRADHLRDDLQRHLNHQPLRHAANPSLKERVQKWTRRHPRLASSGAVAVAASILLLAVGGAAVYAREEARDLEARTRFADHHAAFDAAQLHLDDRNQSRPHLDESWV